MPWTVELVVARVLRDLRKTTTDTLGLEPEALSSLRSHHPPEGSRPRCKPTGERLSSAP